MRADRPRYVVVALVLFMACTAAALATAATADAPRITKEDAKTMLGAPNVVFLDARTGGSWSSSNQKIKGAVRVDPRDVSTWAGSYQKDTKLIVYCS